MANTSLLPASFRGAEFFVSSISMGFGRRGVMHHSPFNDTPFYEDLGRKGRVFTIEAYVMSDRFESSQSYEIRRDKLISEIENKGSGILVHPTMGNIRVAPTDCRVTFNNSEGRIERLSITFEEEGKREAPKRNTKARIDSLTLRYFGKQSTAFTSKYTIGKYKDNKSLPDSFLKSLTKVVEKFLKEVDELASKTSKDSTIGSFSKDFLELTTTLSVAPQQIMASASTLFDPLRRVMYGFSQVTTNPLDILENSLSIFGDFFGLAVKSRDKFKSIPVALKGSPQYRQAQSEVAIYSLILAMTIEEISSISIGSTSASNDFGIAESTETDAISFTDAKSMEEYKEYVNNAFTSIIEFVGDSDDQSTYDDLLALQASLNLYFNETIKTLPDVRIISTIKTLPSLVIAYNYYEDSERNDDLINRNSISNPNSVEVGDIEVLS